MSQLPENCIVKLNRAQHHLDALKEAVHRGVNPEPDLIPGEFDPGSGQYIFRAQRDSSTPLPWSAILGDLIHNLYAALDHLACALVEANSQPVTSRTAFPIFQDRTMYGDARSGAAPKLKGMSSGAQTLIERLQPFHRPDLYHPSEHPLALLYALEQWDKHHALILVDHAIGVRPEGLPPQVHQGPGFRFMPGAYERGAILTRLNGYADQPDMHVHLKATYQVVLNVRWPVGPENLFVTLERIRKHVHWALPLFTGFL